MPSGSVVRQRQKAATPAANGKPHLNGSATLAATVNGAAKASPAGVPSRNGNAPTTPPLIAMPRAQPPQQPQPTLAPLSPNPLTGSSPPPFARSAPDRTPNEPPPNIVSPLAEALARASATPPLPGPPPAAPSIVPASLRSDTPTGFPPAAPPPLPADGTNGAGFPSQPSTQPDFSTLPPSIAASLARLAGSPLPTGRTSGGPAIGESSGEPKKVSNAGSGGA